MPRNWLDLRPEAFGRQPETGLPMLLTPPGDPCGTLPLDLFADEPAAPRPRGWLELSPAAFGRTRGAQGALFADQDPTTPDMFTA
ncbi:hypothetical protein [Bailinhaonella thermotolerans]|uniref:Uncharacterized protein n=1 Tax=Bailinhaonella thermotolerans TaxID=1070861 RepID=A0A3A4A3M0_9ACTN|nr:hypothetical protein [Bailinhaonella thermotolerans]RJL19246.1 hypothetical protein D5H75_40585 [Bailinhaonella thermotolerans]